jgi:phosphoglucosamine mutase
MKVAFGTDGIRGRAGEPPITAEIGVAIGRAVAGWGGHRVIIARDTRPSGMMLEAAVAAGVCANGGTAEIAGVLPTSGLAAALAAGLGDTGVMLTASHNPASDNGFKVLGPGGRKLLPEEEQQIEAAIAGPAVDGRMGQIRGIGDDALLAYTAALTAAFGDVSPFEGRKVAFDLANGASGAVRDYLAGWLRAEVLFVRRDSAINDGVGSEHPEALQALVRQAGCDAGIAVDGDGDRCRIVDERGEIVNGDALAHGLVRAGGHAAVAVTVMSNAALEASLPGVRVLRTDVGDRHLLRAIAEGKATLGCEESGHVVFADALPTGDGLVTGVRALSAALRHGTASSWFSAFVPYPRRLGKIRVRERAPLPSLADERLGPHGRIFLRYSGTEPVLRVLVEGEDAGAVDAVYADVIRRLEA